MDSNLHSIVREWEVLFSWLINMHSQKSIIPENSWRFLSWGQVCGCSSVGHCSSFAYFPLEPGREKKGFPFLLSLTRMGTDRALLPHDLSLSDTKWLKSQSNRATGDYNTRDVFIWREIQFQTSKASPKSKVPNPKLFMFWNSQLLNLNRSHIFQALSNEKWLPSTSRESREKIHTLHFPCVKVRNTQLNLIMLKAYLLLEEANLTFEINAIVLD